MRRFTAVASVALCLTYAGCGESGPELGAVTGVVTLDGKPYPNALVTFTPKDGGPASTGVTDASGAYELLCLDRKGAPLGQHQVSVTTISQTVLTEYPEVATSSDNEAYEKQATGSTAAEYAAAAPAQPKEPIPAKYNAQSTLLEEVKSGGNVINLELTSS
jgi:hypothetical protein